MAISSFIPHALLLSVIGYNYFNNNGNLSNTKLLKSLVQVYILVIGILFFIGNVTSPVKVANSIGWDYNNGGYHKEAAIINLAMSAGALYTFINPNINVFRTVAVIYSAWISGSLLLHLCDIMKHKNFSFKDLVAVPSGSLLVVILFSFLVHKV
jgi:hypothetical protein